LVPNDDRRGCSQGCDAVCDSRDGRGGAREVGDDCRVSALPPMLVTGFQQLLERLQR
jgi:hypothetical protein